MSKSLKKVTHILIILSYIIVAKKITCFDLKIIHPETVAVTFQTLTLTIIWRVAQTKSGDCCYLGNGNGNSQVNTSAKNLSGNGSGNFQKNRFPKYFSVGDLFLERPCASQEGASMLLRREGRLRVLEKVGLV